MRPQQRSRRPVLAALLLCLAIALPTAASALGGGDSLQRPQQQQPQEASISPLGAIEPDATVDHTPLLDEPAARRLQRAVAEEVMKEAAAAPDQLSRSHYYAATPFFDHMMNASWGCPYFRFARAMLTTLCENVSSTTSAKLPLNPTGLLPMELTDLRPDPPFEVPKALIDHERPTYYWLYRHINNMYNFANRYDDEGEHVPAPPVPPGWSGQKLHLVTHDNIRVWPQTYMKTPMAMTMMHHGRNTMLVVIRGTLARQEWAYDFQYNFATPESGATQEFPGRVHQGVYDVYSKLRDSILAEVARFNPGHVFITGHSLGGALTHLTSYAVASRFPSTRVDAVPFASILVGDEAFMAAIKAIVNLRAVMYLGTGWDGSMDHLYRVGDMIPQFGANGFHGCPSLYTGNSTDSYHYAMLGPYVPFYSEDMPNTESWVYEESLLNPYYRFYVTTHMCSYICWTAQGLDPETRCFFPRQYLANPGKYNRKEICLVWSPLGQQVI